MQEEIYMGKYLLLNDKVGNGFYTREIHDIIPEGCVPISDELWEQLLSLGMFRQINDKLENLTIEDFEAYEIPLTELEIKRNRIMELEQWFIYYDEQIKQYERDERLKSLSWWDLLKLAKDFFTGTITIDDLMTFSGDRTKLDLEAVANSKELVTLKAEVLILEQNNVTIE